MDMATVLREVETWPREQKLRLMEQVWDGLLKHGDEPPVTPEQMAELERRLAHLDAHPDDVIPWEVVERDILRQR